MDILQYICTLLGLCGCLRPASWTSSFGKISYKVYASVVWLTIHVLALSQILDLIVNVDNQDDFSDNFYVTMAVFGICFKMSSLLMNQRNVRSLIDTLQQQPFLPANTEEFQIRTKFDKMTEWNAIAYTIILKFYIAWMCITSLFTGFRHRKLLYRAWLPFDYTPLLSFTVTYIYQVIAILYCSFVTIACDSLFSGFIIHIYCQFEILEHRLKLIKKDKIDSAKRCAFLHNRIYKFSATVNRHFVGIMFSQSLVSLSTVCLNLYQLTQRKLDSKFFEIALYSFNTVTQIFYYCWYGNEIKLKSLDVPDAIFATNWTSLDDNAKKILVMIMRRASTSIEFSSMYILPINLGTFTTLVKTSYSAYNLLQRGQD